VSPAKLFIFFRDVAAPEAHLYFELSIPEGRKQVFQIVFPKDHSVFEVGKFCAIATVFCKRGQSSICASN
jgi:hypothetical protein